MVAFFDKSMRQSSAVRMNNAPGVGMLFACGCATGGGYHRQFDIESSRRQRCLLES